MPLAPDEFEQTIIGSRQLTDAAPAVDAIGHYLVMFEGSEPGKRTEIGPEPITIGRDAQQTIVVADAELSRRHARVTLVNNQAVVEDLGSTNGTFVDGIRISAPATLREVNVLRIGRQFFRYERRSRRDVERAQELDRDLLKASRYVLSLLPPPLTDGAVLTDWRFVPSTQLGGDAFGYYWLDPNTFVFYLIDVSGHGAGSAMHSVTVMNVLRQRALPNVDFTDPASVLASLNARFQIGAHNGLFFTMWYGVYDTRDRSLTCGAAGHHPAYLVPADKDAAQPLGNPALMIGIAPDVEYDIQRTTVPPGASLFVFSDGVFEIVTGEEQRWGISDFLPLLLEPAIAGTSEPDRIYAAVKNAAKPGPFDDDFSLLAVRFP